MGRSLFSSDVDLVLGVDVDLLGLAREADIHSREPRVIVVDKRNATGRKEGCGCLVCRVYRAIDRDFEEGDDE